MKGTIITIIIIMIVFMFAFAILRYDIKKEEASRHNNITTTDGSYPSVKHYYQRTYKL